MARGRRDVGITSGASAPEELVERLVRSSASAATTDVEEFEVVQEDVRFMLPKTIRQAVAAQRVAGVEPAALRKACLSHRARTRIPFGPQTSVFKVEGKLFALAALRRRAAVSLKCEPEIAVALRERHDEVVPGASRKAPGTPSLLAGSLTVRSCCDMIEDSYEPRRRGAAAAHARTALESSREGPRAVNRRAAADHRGVRIVALASSCAIAALEPAVKAVWYGRLIGRVAVLGWLWTVATVVLRSSTSRRAQR